MKYAVVTFGCRVNQADSIDIERQLRAAGGRPVAPGEAELVVVNTCSVTATADHGARQTIRRIARTNPAARIVATGCYASRDGAAVAALPGVSDIVDNRDKERLAERLRLAAERTTAERFGGGEGACGDAIRPGTAGRTGYTLRVQTGCDQTCAYCIIPSTRGAGRSVPLERVSAELDAVAAAGFQEAAVTGVHLGSYGRDLEPRHSLIGLLRMLDAHPSALLFRLSSLEPMDCGPEVVDLVARSGRFAPHFHLPLQNASDAVLRLMRRPYTSDYYRRLVLDVRERLPDAAIGSDMIVGFPGETDADADINLTYLRESPLTYLHVFPYSDRPGTDATRMPNKVPGAGHPRAGPRGAGSGGRAGVSVPRVAARQGPLGPHHGGRHRRGDRQLSEGQGAREHARQPPRPGAHHGSGRVDHGRCGRANRAREDLVRVAGG